MIRKISFKTTLICVILCLMAVLHFNTHTTYSQEPEYGGTLIIGQEDSPKTFIQHLGGGGQWITVLNLYNTLVNIRIDGKILPALAKDWEVSDDGLTWTLHLFDNVTWHDGVKFTSADVIYTFENLRDQSLSGWRTYLWPIESMEAPDDYTLVFKTDQPRGNFLFMLGAGGAGSTHILPKHIWDIEIPWGDNTEALWNPIGTGAFKFKEYIDGDRTVLEANENYHLGRPYLDKVIVKIVPSMAISQIALAAGEVDYQFGGVTSYSELKGLGELENIDINVDMFSLSRWLTFNMQRKPWDDLRVRQAIMYAIDFDEINQKVFLGLANSDVSPFSPWQAWCYNPDAKYPPADIEMANQLLDEAGYPRGGDDVRFKTSIVFDTTKTEVHDIAAILKVRLELIGIELEIEPLEYGDLWERTHYHEERDFDLEIDIIYSNPEPQSLTKRYVWFSQFNIMSYHAPQSLYNASGRVLELIDLGESEFAEDERAPYYKEMQEVLLEELPYINLIDMPNPNIYNNKFHGWMWELGECQYLGLNTVWKEAEGQPPPEPSLPWNIIIASVAVVAVVAIAAVVLLKRR